MVDAARVETTSRAGEAVPAYRGRLLSGHLGAFRADRVGLQLRVARERPDIAALRFGFVRTVVVGAPALAHEVLVTQADAFVKTPGLAVLLRPLLGAGLLTSERDFHARQRKLIAPAFAARRVASYAATMAERAARFAEGVPDGEVLDVSAAMMQLTLEIVGKALFDAEVAGDAREVGDAITTAMECTMVQMGSLVPVPPAVPTPSNLRFRRAVARLDRVLYRIIRERRAGDDRGDLLSILLAARDESGTPMPDEQVRDEAMTLFLAGHETTANAMAWTLLLLADNPQARERLEAELDALGRAPSHEDLARLPYALAVVKEAMRLYPPAYLLGRRATRDLVLGGFRIPKNTMVLVNTFGIHRRADLWEHPDAFRPERFLGDAEKALPRCAYLPFGAGPRVCIGNHFAMMEAHVLLATIARRLRFERVGTERVAMDAMITLRPRDLRLRARVR